MIVYNKTTGDIYHKLPDSTNIANFYEDWHDEFKNNLGFLLNEDIPQYFLQIPPRELRYHKIVDDEFVKRPEYEIEEIKLYGKILTEEERQLNKLKPSPEEVRKAEQTIEILTLIQEVI